MHNKFIYLSLTCLYILSITGCQKKNPIDDDGISYDGINLYYNASDTKMATFLNDFTHRNMRYDADSCGEFPVGGGTGFAKNWETMAITFQNATKQVYREDKIEKIAWYLNIATQDDQGLIYNTPMTIEPAFSKAGNDPSGYCVPQGWPFPSWSHSVNNFLDYGNLHSVHTTEFNFNDVGHVQNENWHSTNGRFSIGKGREQTGYAYFSTDANIASGTSFKFYRDQIDTLLPFAHGIDTRFAPMIDMEISFDAVNLEDYGIYFKVSGDDTEYFAPQSVYASTPVKNLNTHVNVRQFIDMYL